MKVPCALAIAGSDSGGGAGVQADLKTFSALGVHGLCVLTAVTAQNTRGIEATFELPPEFVTQQLDTVMRDFDVEWAKTGMLGSAGIIRAVEAGAKRYKLRLVVDPVMVAATGAPLLREDALAALVRLLKHAELVTPNVPEAERLSGIKIKSRADVRRAARAISKLGPRAVLIKGGHLKGREVVDFLYSDGKFKEFKGPRIAGGPTHGTGCSFASAITAELAKGASLNYAIARAKEFVEGAIETRLRVGEGLEPVNQMAALLLSAEKGRSLEEVWQAAKLLVENPKFVELLPEVGSNIVMALPGAEKTSDVVGLSGRIVKSGGRARLTGFPEFGGSEHVANIVLTAMQHDPKIRAGLNIRYSPDVLRACRNLGLTIGTFERSREPRGVKTMVWGTEQAIKRAGKVPQVIFDRGAPGKEAMMRLLGRSPLEVAELALQLARSVG
ncbi:MAG: bifunctional hydroxymethylpyrimidine kinase/phosphomethylpyrimidine kinase [Candidatus Hodarchaeaceae archaeon]|nr:bifunctional hydroxymethylpyrimidine kinase/phosphomethylpyrimidine kinase [Candidatus Hodarchaeaceae archaeon]